jgi:quercetin dioxygenase-like cupin family protein
MTLMDEALPVTFLDVTWELAPAASVIEAVRPAPSRERIAQLQEALSSLPQIETGLEHYFADGMYGRRCTIPAGTVVVGKVHRHEHFVFLLRGTATINTDRGMETITGPKVWVSPPGAKRALVTHDECEFFTTHLNHGNERDLERIEAEVIEPEGLLTQDHEVSEFTDELQRMYA